MQVFIDSQQCDLSTKQTKGNFFVGNDKDLPIAVKSSNLPFIGYPRTLNALNSIREVEK